MIKKSLYVAMACGIALTSMSCENQKFNNTFVDSERVHLDTLSAELQKVRDYVPDLAVVAHRGTTYWAPEETEAAYRWAREIGADYLEADLQVSKDGVILALHDSDLKRTTNIEDVFGERFPEEERKEFYEYLYKNEITDNAARAKFIDSLLTVDRTAFVPNYPCSYTYYELLMLDAGSWFNQDPVSAEQARPAFASQRQYISTLEDLIMYSKGHRLARYGVNTSTNAADAPLNFWERYTNNGSGERVLLSMKLTDKEINNPVNFNVNGQTVKDRIVRYTFEYADDAAVGTNKGATRHVPGIYIEFKEPWLNPSNFEELVYEELTMAHSAYPQYNMNIIAGGEGTSSEFYKDGCVNVGNTNGKVILQTFSLESLTRVCKHFDGQVPMCFLLWKGTGATDLHDDSPQGYASFINLGIKYKAHFMGPCIAGAPNNYPELNQPWQHNLIHRAKMKNHPYSFDTYDQMAKYFGLYNWDKDGDGARYAGPYVDAYFTNHTDMSLQFMKDHADELNISDDMRKVIKDKVEVPDARKLLDDLGYAR